MSTEALVDDRDGRRERIRRWETQRDSAALIIGSRRGLATELNAAIRHLYEHVREFPHRPLDRLDLFLVGAGLSPELGARIAFFLREYTRELNVVLTGPTGPGETIAALAADNLLMHPLASLSSLFMRSASLDEQGLTYLVAHHVPVERGASSSLTELVGRVEPPTLGRALHRVDWSRAQVRHLCETRLMPPEEEAVDELLAVLTRRLGEVDEALSRREARGLDALPVSIPTPELEATAFDLLVAYESALDLLGANGDGSTAALLESEGVLHTLDAPSDGSAGELAWNRRFESAVH